MSTQQLRSIDSAEHSFPETQHSPAARVSTGLLAARALAMQHERLIETVIQNSSELVVVLDRTGVLRFLSPALGKLLGYRIEDRVGQSGFSLIHPDDRGEAIRAFTSLAATPGASTSVEHRVQHANGTYIWMESTARNLFDEPAINGILINSRDVTDRKRSIEQKTHFASVVAASGEAIIASTFDGTIASWNPSAERLYGYAAEEAMGKPLSLLTPPECEREPATIISRIQHGGIVQGYETIRVRKDGSRVRISLSVSPIRDHLGMIVGFSSVARDVSADHAAEAALRESAESFESLFHARAEGSAIHENKIIVMANRTFAEMLGTTMDAVIGRSVLEFVADNSKEYALEQSRVREGGTYQIFARRSDGTEFPVDVMASPMRYRGRDMRLITIRDNTSRYSAEAAIRASEEKFRSLVQNGSDIITVVGESGETYFVSPSLERVLGYSLEMFNNLRREDIVYLDDVSHLTDCWQDVARGDSAERRIVYRVKHAAGHWLWFDAVLTKLTMDSGVQGIVTNARDITERKVAEARLHFATELLDQAMAAVVATTMDGVITHWNRYAEELYGWCRDEAVGKRVRNLIPMIEVPSPKDEESPLRSGRSERELTVTCKDGSMAEVQVSSSHVFDENDQPIGFISVAVDIGERKRLEEQLRYSALHDPLTGLPNRALLSDRLHHALEHSKRRGVQVALLFLDLDRFKLINDSFGHAGGDKVLRDVAKRLEGSLRSGDTLARIGGDEFVVLLEDIREQSVVTEVAKRLSDALEYPFDLDGKEMRIGVSIGISLGASDCRDPERMMSEADTALYRAKAGGRGTISFFNPAMMSNAERRLALELELRNVVKRGELELHYQPIIDLSTGIVREVEALARWRHSEYGMLPPSEFIPLAEETGMIIPIGRWVAMESCRQAARWKSSELAGGVEPAVSINLSAAQFRDPKLAYELARELDRTGLDPARLNLEITEHLLVVDVEGTAKTLSELRDLGVKIAIDDFGTGYSSLGYLRHLPVDAIKLDRAFVRGLGADAGSLAIVEGITALAHSLGLSVTAEGIETEEQLAYVRSAGCDRGQGYLFARPSPAREITRWLDTSSTEYPNFLQLRAIGPTESGDPEGIPLKAS